MRDVFVFYGTAPSCNAERLTELIIDVAVNNDICTSIFSKLINCFFT